MYRFETIKRIHLTLEPFTVENGTLTPTFKIRRKDAYTLHKKDLDELYALGEPRVTNLWSLLTYLGGVGMNLQVKPNRNKHRGSHYLHYVLKSLVNRQDEHYSEWPSSPCRTSSCSNKQRAFHSCTSRRLWTVRAREGCGWEWTWRSEIWSFSWFLTSFRQGLGFTPCVFSVSMSLICSSLGYRLWKSPLLVYVSNWSSYSKFRSSSLPSEALEEFLSILKPTFFSPTSPILRARIHGSTISLPNIPSERPYPFKNRGRLEVVPQKNESNGLEDTDLTHAIQSCLDTSSSTPESVSDKGEGGADFDSDLLNARWYTAHCHCACFSSSIVLDEPSSQPIPSFPYLQNANQKPFPTSSFIRNVFVTDPITLPYRWSSTPLPS